MEDFEDFEDASTASTPPTEALPSSTAEVGASSAPKASGVPPAVPDEPIVEETHPNATEAVGSKRPNPSSVHGEAHAKKGKKKRSPMWDHFKQFSKDGELRAKCNYCPIDVCGDPKKGTSVLKRHLDSCKEYQPNIDLKQALLSLQMDNVNNEATSVQKSGKLEFRKFNQKDGRLILSKMIIMDEMPFRTVEHEGFRLYSNYLQPQFTIPSRFTVARDCLFLYTEEKEKLKSYFNKFPSRICLTTDTWTSCQNLGYMVLTAHFIDQNWKLHKKILNFCPIGGHDGETIGKSIEACLIEWGIGKKVLTVTVDNASANDKGVEHLSHRILRWNGAILGGKFLHMRCGAHILSLLVREGLKDTDTSILRIRHAVRFVRSSPARTKKFDICVDKEQIQSNRKLCLDVETRWNSTFHMLETALIFRKAFAELASSDRGVFLKEMNKHSGPPTDEDWDRVASFLPFLKIFYNATLKLSGTLYCTADTYLPEFVSIGVAIKKMCTCNDVGVSLMAEKMKTKYSKYWDKLENVNVLLYIAVILDPRKKMQYVDWAIRTQYDMSTGEKFHELVKSTLESLYDHYASLVPKTTTVVDSVESSPSEGEGEGDVDWVVWAENDFERDVGERGSPEIKTELETYLNGERETNKKIGTLEWWSKRKETYPILCLMAKDILAIPVSTVASESAFSTGGRVLDQFRSSLSTRMVEALVCAQDWLRLTRAPLIVEECVEEVEQIEREFANLPSRSNVADDYF